MGSDSFVMVGAQRKPTKGTLGFENKDSKCAIQPEIWVWRRSEQKELFSATVKHKRLPPEPVISLISVSATRTPQGEGLKQYPEG